MKTQEDRLRRFYAEQLAEFVLPRDGQLINALNALERLATPHAVESFVPEGWKHLFNTNGEGVAE